ncbi:MAG: ABC transporter permease [Anaerolinea sp.]
MKKILAIIRKDILLRFSSPAEWLFFLILPIVFTVVLSMGTPSENADHRSVLLVVDEAQTSLSREILRQLEKSSVVRPVETNRQDAEQRFRERKVEFWMLIPEGVTEERQQKGEDLTLTFYEQPNQTIALAARRSVQESLRAVTQSLQAAQFAVEQAEEVRPFDNEAQRLAYYQEARSLAIRLQNEAPERLAVIRENTPDSVPYDPRANSSAGQLITWVFIPLFGISVLMVGEREGHTLARLMTTPTSAGTFLAGTILGQVFLALVQMALLIGFGMVVLKVPWGRELLGLALLLTASALSAAALGTLLGTMVRSTSQANNLSIMLGMVMALLGGCWYPLELFPQAVQTAVKILPTTWAMQGMLDLTLRAGSVRDIWLESGVLLGFAAVFFLVGIWRFRRQLR